MTQGVTHRHRTAHRVPEQVARLHAEVVEHGLEIGDESGEAVAALVADVGARAVPSMVERDDLAVDGQIIDHVDPVVRAAREPVHEHERRLTATERVAHQGCAGDVDGAVTHASTPPRVMRPFKGGRSRSRLFTANGSNLTKVSSSRKCPGQNDSTGQKGTAVDFDIPKDLADYLVELDEFIEREIKPLEQKDDNIRFFDHRREDARTDWERGGLPNGEWEALLHEARTLADKAGHYRYPFPTEYGGKNGTNLGMAVIREHLASKGLGLHCDLQNEHAIVGNNVGLLLMINYGTDQQKAEWIDDLAEGRRGFAFGITEPQHGSDATWMETHAERDGDEWIINGEKTWNTGMHTAKYDLIFARTSGKAGDGNGITAFLTPTDSPGFKIEEFLWTFNMPTDHAHVSFTNIRVPHDSIFGGESRGLQAVSYTHLRA